jgi:eukaryotic-like serine/threonine-protein kinase
MNPQPPTAIMVDPIIGQTIGNYRVSAKVGEGGMGSVYLAEHPHIGKRVALKVLHAEFASNTEVVSRFFNEAKAVNDIGHPNIVDVIDYGVLSGANPGEKFVYFIMEYLAGLTLSQLIRTESPLPPERALAIALQCADALAASHRCEIVHRDLKPDNIILQQRGRERDFVKLLDFGIAKLTGEQHGSQRTRTGIVMGTPAYMSPEQCEGKGNVDHRTDVYALGIVLYEMLTGRVPFIGEGYGEILVQHLTQKPISPSQFRVLPPHVEAVVVKALEKNPDNRYPNMDEFMRALADPVAYVEHNGGINGFATHRIVPSAPGTPLPSLPPVALTPTPGTLGAVVRPTMSQTSGSKKAPIIIGGLLAIAGIVIAVVVMRGGSKNSGTNTVADAALPTNIPPAIPDATIVIAVDAPTPPPSVDATAMTVAIDAPVVGAKVKITITTVPPGADITIGDQAGKSPMVLEVDSGVGSVKVSAKRSGFETILETVDVSKGSNVDREWKLKRKSGIPPQHGSGSNAHHDGDGLMKPGDL